MTDPTTDPARGVPDCWLPAAQQCPGCTYYASQVRELAYLHARGVTYATVCQGPLDESLRYRDFLGWETPWYATGGDGAASAARGLDGAHALLCYLRIGDRVFETYRTGGRGVEVMSPTYGLLDMTVHGRGEPWEDSPAGWPQPLASTAPTCASTGAPSRRARASPPDTPRPLTPTQVSMPLRADRYHPRDRGLRGSAPCPREQVPARQCAPRGGAPGVSSARAARRAAPRPPRLPRVGGAPAGRGCRPCS